MSVYARLVSIFTYIAAVGFAAAGRFDFATFLAASAVYCWLLAED